MKNKKTYDMNPVRYHSFSEAAEAFGCKPVSHKTKDTRKLAKQQESFASHHICKACKKPMTFIPESNIFVCQNEDCRGIKVEKKDEDGTVVSTTYLPSFDMMDEDGAKIANYIF